MSVFFAPVEHRRFEEDGPAHAPVESWANNVAASSDNLPPGHHVTANRPGREFWKVHSKNSKIGNLIVELWEFWKV